MYIVSMTYQIFIPCYFGSIVQEKSEQLPFDLVDSNWLEGKASLRRSVTIIGERVKRPITPFAGGLFAVGLPTFVSVKKGYNILIYLVYLSVLISDYEIGLFSDGLSKECGESAIICEITIFENRELAISCKILF